jgi:hypothetical protein
MNDQKMRPSPGFWSAILLLSSMCFGLPGAIAATPSAKPSIALVKKEQSAAKTLAQLASLQRQAQASIGAANAMSQAGRASQTRLEGYQASDLRLREALQQANACLPELRSHLAAMNGAKMRMQQALAQSHAAVQTIAQASDTALAGAAQAADAAFAQRDATELGLRREHEALQKQARRCSNLTNSAQWTYSNSDASARRLADQARRLIELRQTSQTRWQAAHKAFTTATQARWLTAPVAAHAPAGDQHVAGLARALANSTRWAPNTQMASGSLALAPALDGLAPLWAQLARLQDAAVYLDTQLATSDCPPAACAAFTAERRDLAQRIATTQERLDKATKQWQQTPETLNQSLEDTAAQHLALTDAVGALVFALVPAIAQTQGEAQAIALAAQPLLTAAQSAHAKAQREWQAAYRLAYGRTPDTGDRQATAASMGMAAPAPAPSAAMASMPDIRNHAFEMFSELDGEIEGFGAYTYVLVRSAIDMKSAPVRGRFVRLLATLQSLPDATLVAKDLAQHANVFCVPVLPGSERTNGPDEVRYASDLGQQIKMRAQNGLLTQTAVRYRLSNSPGPFLITLPTRLSKAQSSTPVLIADLSTYPEQAIADLANHYMRGLVDDFPRQKALWRPPVLQRVALFMIHMAEGTGALITSAMPTAQAATPQQ